jgi:hypothetical protein
MMLHLRSGPKLAMLSDNAVEWCARETYRFEWPLAFGGAVFASRVAAW